MTTRGARRGGIVLVTVLLVSLAMWLLLAGLLVTLRLQLQLAVAASDQRIAREAALTLVERARAHDWWGGAEPPTDSGGAGDGLCVWTLGVDALDDERARYAAEVRYGRATVRVDATAQRPR